MKKILAVLLSALLALSASGTLAEVTVTPYVSISGDARLVQYSDALCIVPKKGSTLAAIASMDGTLLTEPLYTVGMSTNYGWIRVKLNDDSEYNQYGLVDSSGVQAVPCQYRDIRVLNPMWAVGFTLALSDANNYDYTGSDAYFLIDHADIYYLPEGRLAVSLPRANYMDARAYGDYINIEDRASGTVTTYDSAFNALGTVKDTWDRDLIPGYHTFRDNGRMGMLDADGNEVLPALFKYVEDTVYADGSFVVSDGEKYGLANVNGEVLLQPVYDRVIYAYGVGDGGAYSPFVIDGYVHVEVDGKCGYVSVPGGEVTCEPTYSKDILTNNGVSCLFTDLSGTANILAADGTLTSLSDYADARVLDNSLGRLYRVTDTDGNYGLVDWHGQQVLPCEYSGILMNRSGNYLAASRGYKDPLEIFAVSFEDDAATADEAPVGEPAGEPTAETNAVSGLLHSLLKQKDTDDLNGGPESAPAEPVAGIEPPLNATWACPECGTENTGKFCIECGAPKPESEPAPESWSCPGCGQENTGKFCSECGTPRPEGDWTCPDCGTVNGGKFCTECGAPRP